MRSELTAERATIARETTLPVLMYHAVTPVAGRLRKLGLAAGLLAEQLTALQEAGFLLLGLTEARSAEKPAVAITFDDAYRDFLELALPVLESRAGKATVYAPTAYLGSRAGWLGLHQDDLPKVMSIEELSTCAQTGLVEIGSHSHSHLPLDTLEPAVLQDEIVRSKRILEDRLGESVESFCYPHGYHSRQVREAVRLAGYSNACEIGRRLRRRSDPFAISRLAVDPYETPEALIRSIETGGPRLIPTTKRLLQPGWRLVRRRGGGLT